MKINFPKAKLKFKLKYRKRILRFLKVSFWFTTGAFLALILVLSFGLSLYQKFMKIEFIPVSMLAILILAGKTNGTWKTFLITGTP